MAALTRTPQLALRTTLRRTLYNSRRLYSVSQNAHEHEEADVVIVGGGPAGLALANALGSSKPVRESQKVVLVEAGDLAKVSGWTMPADTFSNRVSSITNASQSFLVGTGAWDHIDAQRTAPVHAMEVWDGVSDARVSFTASELGLGGPNQDGMARLTENLNIQRALLRSLSGVPSIQLIDNVKVSSIEREEREGGGWPLVHLSNGRVLRARLLVGADGFNSPVRTFAGIGSYGWSYDTQAIVGTLFHPPRSQLQGPNTVAYQRFLPTGPIAFLPLAPTASSLVWSTTPALAKALQASEPDVLVRMVNAAFRLPWASMRYLHTALLEAHAAGAPLTAAQVTEEIAWRERAHAIAPTSAYASAAAVAARGVAAYHAESLPPLVASVQPGTVASFPLRYNHADAYVGEGSGARTVLVGDAAHTVHPLAGQGLNMGLADVEALARCIHDAVLTGSDIGSRTALLPYTRARYFENHKLMSAVDKLHRLYATTAAPVVWARSVGLEVVNELDTVKAALMLSAGAHARVKGRSTGSVGWNIAARGVESMTGAVGVAKVLGGALQNAVGVGLQEVGKRLAGQTKA